MNLPDIIVAAIVKGWAVPQDLTVYMTIPPMTETTYEVGPGEYYAKVLYYFTVGEITPTGPTPKLKFTQSQLVLQTFIPEKTRVVDYTYLATHSFVDEGYDFLAITTKEESFKTTIINNSTSSITFDFTHRLINFATEEDLNNWLEWLDRYYTPVKYWPKEVEE